MAIVGDENSAELFSNLAFQQAWLKRSTSFRRQNSRSSNALLARSSAAFHASTSVAKVPAGM